MKLLWLAGLGLLGGIALQWRIRRDARRAEVAYPPQGDFVQVGQQRLHYMRRGQGASVLLLHGSDGFLQDFAPLFQETSAAQFDLIALDRPGHGYSDAGSSPPSLSAQAHLLHSALEQLGVSCPFLVGHSWSAALCLYYALEYPQNTAGLILISPWVYPTANSPSALHYAAYWIGKYIAYTLLALTPLKRLLLRSSLKQAFSPAAVPRAYEEEAFLLWQRSPAQVGVFLRENVEAWRELQQLAPRYPQIKVPVFLLAGDSDKTVHAKFHALALHQALPVSELQIVPQAGHELPHLQASLVLQAIAHCQKKARFLTPLKNARPSIQITPESREARSRARELVFRYGWNATAYQILNPDVVHWFTADGRAVVGYVQRFKRRVAAGAPVCEETRLAEVTAQFEQDAAENGERVCWLAATTRLKSALVATKRPHAELVLGGQPVWNPVHWTHLLKKNASLRAQLNRARNKGVAISEWSEKRATNHEGLQQCLEQWLARHPLPTLHFLTEPVTLDRLTDRRIWVAEQGDIPQGFLIATPVPSRQGWLVEQIVRGENAPNGTSELLVDAAMEALAVDGCAYVTLGLVPLTPRVWGTAAPPRFWLRTTLRWARLHGQRFYNFEGLDAFKAKFKPETWEPLFALSNEPRISVRTLMAIVAAFSDGPLLWTILRALMAAARQEAAWLKQRVKQGTRK